MGHETYERALDQGHHCAMSAVSAQRAVRYITLTQRSDAGAVQ